MERNPLYTCSIEIAKLKILDISCMYGICCSRPTCTAYVCCINRNSIRSMPSAHQWRNAVIRHAEHDDSGGITMAISLYKKCYTKE